MIDRVDRIGEENVNNFGSKMLITRYKSCKDIDVYFPKYNWIAKNKEYKKFKKGEIKCPYERRTYGIGYLGEGEYKTKINGKNTKCYIAWKHMLERCYNPKYKEKHPTYINCEVCEEWLCFQNFAEWFYNNYYEIDGEKMQLDKDILCKGNKIYSSENCIFVPEKINKLFTKSDKSRGNYPIGVSYHKTVGKFQANCRIYDFEENKSKLKYLGLYDTPDDAFKVYKQFKENNIKEVANLYKDLISDKLYNIMYKYKVEIND